jgi:hypothetical protein
MLSSQSKQPGFREAVTASSQLSLAQKKRWLALLEREGL